VHGFGDVGFGRAAQVEKIQRREARLPRQRAAFPSVVAQTPRLP
jgi:hypothetical protein